MRNKLFLLLVCFAAVLVSCSADSALPDATNGQVDDYVIRHVELYRVLEPQGDTSVWDASDCHVGDSTFSCSRATNVDCFQSRIFYECKEVDGSPCPKKDTLYDTTYTDLNFGPNARTDYIPYAEIPAFNRDSVKNLFSHLSGEFCKTFVSFSSNYFLEAIGLPDSLTFLKIDEYVPGSPQSIYWDVLDLWNRTDSTGESHCEIVKTSKNVTYEQGACFYQVLPAHATVVKYALYNSTSKVFGDTTVSWKLVYRDDYGRGDTLAITTEFE